jgi:hypothetical protein
MKKWTWILVFFIGTFIITKLGWSADQPNYFFTLEGQYSRHLSVPSPLEFSNNALGTYARAEIAPIKYISLGLDWGMDNYFGPVSGPPILYEGSIDLMGRIMPFKHRIWTPYFIGGIGFNPFLHLKLPTWGGHYHAMIGAGTWYMLTPHWALDMGMLYNFYTPMKQPLQAITLRFGLTFFVHSFVPAKLFPWARKVVYRSLYTPKIHPRTLSEQEKRAYDRKTMHYIFKAESLWEIAKKVYGDPALYPLIVDANFKNLSAPLIMQPGTRLVIPRDVSWSAIERARLEAWTIQYIQWRGKNVTHYQYDQWKKAHPNYRSDYPIAP